MRVPPGVVKNIFLRELIYIKCMTCRKIRISELNSSLTTHGPLYQGRAKETKLKLSTLIITIGSAGVVIRIIIIRLTSLIRLLEDNMIILELSSKQII